MKRAMFELERVREESFLRWAAVAGLVTVWVAIAWTDPRFLLALPLLGGVVWAREKHRRRLGLHLEPRDDFDDWF